MAARNLLIASSLLPPTHAAFTQIKNAAHILTHPTLPCVTYPYEWSFAALKSAALAHLDLHLALLEEGFTLSDASAFNMQLIGAKPMHIDLLSVIPYQPGMRWHGYRQFLQHFLNPLLLESACGLSFAPFFRSSLDGIETTTCRKLLPWHSLLKPSGLLHVLLPGLSSGTSASSAPLKALPQSRYRGLLQHLQNIITSLHPRHQSAWQHYTPTTSYAASAADIKQSLLRDFIQSQKPAALLDIGCNTGQYASLALQSGAGRVIGLDTDRASIDAAFARSTAGNLAFTPLVADISNPSPAQGWCHTERQTLESRFRPGAVIALALIHHLAITRNIPLAQILTYITSLAPTGLIEFIPKSDPQIITMLQHRPDIFPDYTLESARAHLSHIASITAETPIGESGRVLFQFARNP